MTILTSRPPRVCLYPGCGETGDWVPHGGRCPKHRRGTDIARAAQGGPSLNTPTWERMRQSLIGVGNVHCQRIGPCPGEARPDVRCSNSVYIFHHIISRAQRPDLMYHPRNIVGVCRSCHPKPDDGDQGRFVPTLWRTPMSDEPVPPLVCVPGEKVPAFVERWTLANRLVLLH
jgi:hypothetical protein